MKKRSKRLLALLLAGALLAGILPMGTGAKSQAAVQTTLRNPRVLKTTQELEPGSAGKKELKNPTIENGITTWDCVWFGNYWQDDTNGDGKADKNDDKTPIKWRVMSVDGDDAFLVADQNLDCQKYNDTYTDVTWETCTIRSWLNGYGAKTNKDGKNYSDNSFLNNAFSKSEQSAIRITNVVNDDNPGYGTKGGNDTLDRVYLLSVDEVTNPAYGFISSLDNSTKTREAVNTAFAKEKGARTSIFEEHVGNGDWWLRSPGYDSNYTAFSVDDYGCLYQGENDVDYDNKVARPALHLNLSAVSSYSYAGTVTSEGGEIGTMPATPQPEVTEKPDDTSLKNPSVSSDGVTTWDCVYFGNYWQEDTNGDGKADKKDAKTPIKWRVLSVDGDDMFLLADKNLDCQMYNDTYIDVTWETCTMRSWLNGYGAEANSDGKDYSDDNFLNNAFSKKEQSAILTTNVVNDYNPEYGIEGGNDTSDLVYLLSIDEVANQTYGFSSDYSKNDESRRAKNTKYAKMQGAYTNTEEAYAENGWWWLRSPGYGSDRAAYVVSYGHVGRYGNTVYCSDGVVRPALHLNLSSTSSWLCAGTVTSDGKIEEPGSTPTTTPTTTPATMPTTMPTTAPSPTPSTPSFSGDLANPRVNSDEVTTWDCIYFGNYWQEDTNGDGKADKNDAKTPIKWRVLSVNGDDAFLMADKNLDCQSFNDTFTEVTWETCTMRSWLNGYGADANQEGKDCRNNNFLNNAFTKSEQSVIRNTNVVNDGNPEFEVGGGNDTIDKVYLLSIDEVTNPAYGFASSINRTKTREAVNTAYVAGGGEVKSGDMESAGNTDAWWLRSPGDLNLYAAYGGEAGYSGLYGLCVELHCCAVRPALHLNLSAVSSYSYAGTVTSEGGEIGTGITKPTEPGSTQKPQETAKPGGTNKPSAPSTIPGTSSVMPSVPQPGSAAASVSGISPDPRKSTVGKVATLKLKQKKRTVTASWKKLTGVKGYQICYSPSKKWKGKKQKLVSKNNVIIKNLKKKKTYYFRVRAYRLEGTKKVYGAWSGVKKINIKK